MPIKTLVMVLVISIVHALAQTGRGAEPKLFTPISLAPIANRTKMEHLVRPPSGRVTFEGVPFELPTPHQRFETHAMRNNLPLSGGVHTSVPRPLAVYVLLHGSYVPRNHKGVEVGMITLDFEDGSEINAPIKAWVTIRENWFNNDEIIAPGEDKN